MAFPYSDNYDAYQVLKTFAALPAAGAYDTPREVSIVEFISLFLFLTYEDGGGTGGAVDLLVEYSPHANDADAPANTAVWYRATAVSVATITPGTSATETVQDKVTTFTPTSTDPEGIIIELIGYAQQAQRLRVSVAESGDTAAPGNCALILLANK